MHDYLNIILKSPPRRVRTYVHALFSRREFSLQSSNPASQEGVTYKNFIWSPQSKLVPLNDKKSIWLASLQAIKNLIYSTLSHSHTLCYQYIENKRSKTYGIMHVHLQSTTKYITGNAQKYQTYASQQEVTSQVPLVVREMSPHSPGQN